MRVALPVSVRTSHDVSIHTIHFSEITSGCVAEGEREREGGKRCQGGWRVGE